MMRKECSLRVRLLRLLALPLVFAILVTGIASYFSSFKEAEEIYDAHLVHLAKVLLALTQHQIKKGDLTSTRILVDETLDIHEYEKKYAYRVWQGDSLILLSSNSEYFGAVTQTNGFTDRMIVQDRWRFYVSRTQGITVEVAERHDVREDLIEQILGSILFPQIAVLPIFILIIWFGVSYGIRPLDVISGLIRNRDPSVLEPIDAPIVPKEMLPIVAAINDLMKRTSDVLERERHFSNYAAHELRTPLAALKTQIQVALRSRDSEKSQQLFRETLPAIDRMQHLIDQLLTLVRVQRTGSTFERLDFSGLCEEMVREAAGSTASIARTLECDIAPGIFVNGNEKMLQALVRNLLSNAIKYTRENGHIHVSLLSRAKNIVLRVADDGIGIDAKLKDKLFDIFFRAAASHAEGSGLGLAIVKWVARMHHAVIHITPGLKNTGSGFEVKFLIPPDPR